MHLPPCGLSSVHRSDSCWPNGFFLILTLAFGYDSATHGADHVFIDWVWRVPFLASIVMVAIGLWVRLSLEETPVFKQAVAKDERVKAPLKDVFAKNWWELILGTFIMYATYVLFYLMTTWVLSYAIGSADTGGLGTSYNDFLVIQLISILFFAAFVPVSGFLADKFGRKPTMLVITALMIVFGLLFGWWLNADVIISDDGTLNSARMIVFMIVGMSLMGLTFWADVCHPARVVPHGNSVYRFRYCLQRFLHFGCSTDTIHCCLVDGRLRCLVCGVLLGCGFGHYLDLLGTESRNEIPLASEFRRR